MVSSLATKQHKTMHYCETDEAMVGLILSLFTLAMFMMMALDSVICH